MIWIKRMKKFLAGFNKHIYLWGTVFFLAVNLFQLTSMPIFNDEGIYLHWGREFYQGLGKGYPLMVAVDGKQTGVPLVYGLLQFLPIDPLLSVRFFSVAVSLVTFLAILAVYKKVSEKRPDIFLVLLLTFSPYLLFFDRMALPDGLIAACYTLSVLISLSLFEKPQIIKGLALGAVIALGWWFKSTILIILPPFLILLVWRFRKKDFSSGRLIAAVLAGAMIFLLMVAPIIFHPDYQRMAFPESNRIYSFSEVLRQAPKLFTDKAPLYTAWFADYATPLVFMSFLLGILCPIKKKGYRPLFVFLVVPILAEIFLVKIFSARYIVYVLPLFLLFSYEGFSFIKQKSWKYAFLFATLLSSMTVSLLLIFYPGRFYQLMEKFPKGREDLYQYFDGWTSGYGVKEAADWITKDAGERLSVVFVRDDSGNPEDAMYVFLRRDNIKVFPINLLGYFARQKDVRLYFVSRGVQMGGVEKYARLLKRYDKPFGNEYIGIYNIALPESGS